MAKTMGAIICEARKNKGMTQADLAQVMNVTDKAVSKWERNLSCPDVASLTRLAETLGVSLEELVSGKNVSSEKVDTFELALTAVSLAMGVAVIILSILSKLNLTSVPMKTEDLVAMIAVGLTSTAFSKLRKIAN